MSRGAGGKCLRSGRHLVDALEWGLTKTGKRNIYLNKTEMKL